MNVGAKVAEGICCGFSHVIEVVGIVWKPGIGRDVEGDKAEGRSPVPKGLEPQL